MIASKLRITSSMLVAKASVFDLIRSRISCVPLAKKKLASLAS
jgi:hypothetical protein